MVWENKDLDSCQFPLLRQSLDRINNMVAQNKKPYTPPQPPTYRETLKQIGVADEEEPTHDVRQSILQQFRSSGGDYNRWNKIDWRKMSDSIIRYEDDLEYRMNCKNREKARLTLRKLRRILECVAGDDK